MVLRTATEAVGESVHCVEGVFVVVDQAAEVSELVDQDADLSAKDLVPQERPLGVVHGCYSATGDTEDVGRSGEDVQQVGGFLGSVPKGGGVPGRVQMLQGFPVLRGFLGDQCGSQGHHDELLALVEAREPVYADGAVKGADGGEDVRGQRHSAPR
jgi:hypothetical protein